MCFVVRRLASVTSIVRTGTRARSESSRSSPASSSSGSGQKRLKSRSKSSGASSVSTSVKTAAPGAATAGHHVGQVRAVHTSAVRAIPVNTAPSTSPFTTSQSHARNVCVENPQRRSRAQPRHAESGSRTSASVPRTSAVSSSVRAHHGPPVAPQSQSPGGPNTIAASTTSCSPQSTKSAMYSGRWYFRARSISSAANESAPFTSKYLSLVTTRLRR